jgi:hypothetical protein
VRPAADPGNRKWPLRETFWNARSLGPSSVTTPSVPFGFPNAVPASSGNGAPGTGPPKPPPERSIRFRIHGLSAISVRLLGRTLPSRSRRPAANGVMEGHASGCARVACGELRLRRNRWRPTGRSRRSSEHSRTTLNPPMGNLMERVGGAPHALVPWRPFQNDSQTAQGKPEGTLRVLKNGRPGRRAFQNGSGKHLVPASWSASLASRDCVHPLSVEGLAGPCGPGRQARCARRAASPRGRSGSRPTPTALGFTSPGACGRVPPRPSAEPVDALSHSAHARPQRDLCLAPLARVPRP